ncbi:hypothetical protein ABZO31_16570 [Streptomyces sp. HUAS MG47]
MGDILPYAPGNAARAAVAGIVRVYVLVTAALKGTARGGCGG